MSPSEESDEVMVRCEPEVTYCRPRRYPLISEIIAEVERFAPRTLQDGYDNSGLQVGRADRECTGVMIALDPTPDAVRQAVAAKCNLLLTHHPLLFHGLKRIDGSNPVERAVIEAIKADVTVYSAHTSLDKATGGVSTVMAMLLGCTDIRPLVPEKDPSTGIGAVATLGSPLGAGEFLSRVKDVFRAPVLRHTRVAPGRDTVSRIAMCGGSGGSLIGEAVAAGADAYLTSDVRYHDFLDYADRILIADIDHFVSENCTKSIFYALLKEKFPNFAPLIATASESNPINYM